MPHPRATYSLRPRTRRLDSQAPGAANRTAAGAASDYRRELNAGHAMQPGTSLLLANLETRRVVGSPGSVADRLRCALP